SSNRTGQFEIYIERFPHLGERQMVSTNGGVEPLWSADGKKLYYRSLDGRQLLTVPFDAESGVGRGKPTLLFEGPYASYPGFVGLRAYDVTPDGERFVMMRELPATRGVSSAAMQLNVTLDWIEELKRLIPTK